MGPSRALACLLLFMCASAGAAAPEKPQKWVEVRSQNFIVISNGGEKQARRVASQFEQIRAVFRAALPFALAHPSPVITILALKDEKSLGELFPEFWQVKGHNHPVGFFFLSMEEYYIALRLDAEGENPYEPLYHEYFHSLTVPYFPGMPLWLCEGLAEFYGNTIIEGSQVKLGEPSLALRAVVRESKFLPLPDLFRVDQSSPYYNEKNKTTVFYAESWALTHYLMIGDKGAHKPLLQKYLELMDRGASPDEAARQAFGDLNKLGDALQVYVRDNVGFYMTMKAPAAAADKDLHARDVSLAESEAVRGDFLVHRGKLAEAKPLLEDAVRQDPNLAVAHEAMFWLHFREQDFEAARHSLAEAVRLNPNNYLTRYFRATLGGPQGSLSADNAEAESDLRRSVELNPNFAPAYSALAAVEMRDSEKLPDALKLARKAVELEPGRISHRINVGLVLLRMNKMDDALALAKSLRSSAHDPNDRQQVESFLAEVEQYKEILEENEQKQTEIAAGVARGQTGESAGGAANAPLNPIAPKSEPAKPAGPPAIATGTISDVTCEGPELRLTLKFSGHTLYLHEQNYFRMELYATNWRPPDHFSPCQHLKGLSARIKYSPVKDRPYAGEILTLEIRD